MGKFIETTYPTIEDRVSRWETIGMLDSVKSDDSKKLVAMALDATAIYITEFNHINYDKDTKTVLIPVIVRIFNKTNKDFTLETITKSVRSIIEDFVEKYEEAKPKFNPLTSERDDDGEFIALYCENYSFNKKVFIKNKIKFKITFWKDIPERTFIIDDTNFFPKYFMGLDGILYENYGTEEKPMWENVFDSDYEIEIINL